MGPASESDSVGSPSARSWPWRPPCAVALFTMCWLRMLPPHVGGVCKPQQAAVVCKVCIDTVYNGIVFEILALPGAQGCLHFVPRLGLDRSVWKGNHSVPRASQLQGLQHRGDCRLLTPVGERPWLLQAGTWQPARCHLSQLLYHHGHKGLAGQGTWVSLASVATIRRSMPKLRCIQCPT